VGLPAHIKWAGKSYKVALHNADNRGE